MNYLELHNSKSFYNQSYRSKFLHLPIMIILIPTIANIGYRNIGKIRLQFEVKTEVDPLPDMWHP